MQKNVQKIIRMPTQMENTVVQTEGILGDTCFTLAVATVQMTHMLHVQAEYAVHWNALTL